MSDVLNEDDLHSIRHTGIAYKAIPPIHIQPKGGGIMRQAWLCTWVFPQLELLAGKKFWGSDE